MYQQQGISTEHFANPDNQGCVNADYYETAIFILLCPFASHGKPTAS